MTAKTEMNSSEWTLLGKGQANAVYQYIGNTETNSTSSHPEYKNKVLRLRLSVTTDKTQDIYNYIQLPQFDKLRKFIVPMELVYLGPNFNNTIQQRGPQDVQLNCNDTYGLLMPNLFQGESNAHKLKLNKQLSFHYTDDLEYVLLEFKPKWLYDPPYPDQHKCRNCALLGTKNERFVNCTLKLLKGDDGIRDWCTCVQNEIDLRAKEANGEEQLRLNNLKVFDKLFKILIENQQVFKTLYELQNKPGVNFHETLKNLPNLKENVNEEFILFSMTLKDVSIIIDLNSGDLKLIDLDKKNKDKFAKWSSQEKKLNPFYFKD
ncbi:unnamed protein product [Ambrosiozyma monospora]|uniref:Unnamed protein product n=1 Tax=Ambrosiozyma monospora TaxID=43982 RepID=A0ACB5T701_AMBMO|nr:unnamed protein product [Ambrosiozyma monospora]